MKAFLLCLVVLCCFGGSLGDTPANCTYEELLGSWVFQISTVGQDKSIDCSTAGERSALSCSMAHPGGILIIML